MSKIFNLEEFKKLLGISDLQALEYLEKNFIINLEYNEKK